MAVNNCKVAAIQMVSGPDMQENFTQAQALIAQAAERGAELIVLPETFALFGSGNRCEAGEAESSPQGPMRSFLAQQSRRHHVWLVGGTLPTTAANAQGKQPPAGKVFTATYVYNSEGQEVGRYDKVHLFDVDVADGQGGALQAYRESDQFEAGVAPLLVDTPWGKLGVGVCYDLRFPEFFRLLRDQGVVMLAIPAAFTYKTGQAHWEVLLRSRAIENQCYVIAANQGGEHSAKRKTWGDSCVISPWGDKLEQLAQGQGVVSGVLDFEQLEKIRTEMPVQSHRRL